MGVSLSRGQNGFHTENPIWSIEPLGVNSELKSVGSPENCQCAPKT